MAGGKLEVQIGADKSEFDKKIKEIEFDIKELSKVKLDRLKLGLDTTEINNQIKDAKNSLNSFKTTVKDTGAAISGQFTKQVGNGGNTLMQFSRIAQDAPFGIMGIGNNITATAESFGYLKQQTGSTGGALKALASSIAGTGGILLGVSLLTTGLTLLSQSGLSVQDVINKLTGNFDEFGATVNKIAVDSAKNSGAEIAGLKALVSVAQDDLNSRQDRILAVDELQSKYPGYFGNLNKEKILNGDLTSVTNELSKAIIARAEATAIADKIGELASKKLDLQIKKEKEVLGLQKAQQNAKFTIASGGTLGADANISSISRLARATSNVKDLNQQIYDIQVQQDKLAARLNQKTDESVKLLTKKEKEVKEKPARVASSPIASVTAAPRMSTSGVAVLTGEIDEYGNKLLGLPHTIRTAMLRSQQEADKGAAKMAEALFNFNESASQIINTSIADTFAGLGSAIGQALSTGGNVLTSVGKTLLSSLGGILIEIGKMAITIGIGLLGIKAALKTLNPYAAIGAGVALIALGSFFASKSSSIGSSVGGSGASNASGSGANNQSFTSSGFSGGGQGGGTVVFEIAGTKLIGVLSNTINANRRLGGQLGIG
jgi:hypothetical protein